MNLWPSHLLKFRFAAAEVCSSPHPDVITTNSAPGVVLPQSGRQGCLAHGRQALLVCRMNYQAHTESREVSLLMQSRLKREKPKGIFSTFWSTLMIQAGEDCGLEGRMEGLGHQLLLSKHAPERQGSSIRQNNSTPWQLLSPAREDSAWPRAAPGTWRDGSSRCCRGPWHQGSPVPMDDGEAGLPSPGFLLLHNP